MDERLSPIEAIMWKAGQDPTLRMTVGIVMVLDRAPSYDSLVERFAAVIKRSPRLQSRPGGPSFAHACPLWVEDDALDAEHHLRTAAVSRPGSLRQLLDLVGLLESVPFDPDQAPWDGTLIEGLEGDRATLYLRAHHVVTDGLAGLRLAGRFLDGDEIDLREEKAPASGRRSGIPTIDLTKALRPLQVAVNAARDPEPVNVIVRGLQGVLDLATSVSRQVVITGGSLSPLLVDHSMTTRFEVISVPGRACGSTRPRRQPERLARCRRRVRARSVSRAPRLRRVTSCGSPRPPASVAATMWVATGLPPRASRCRPRPGPQGRTSTSSPTD